MAPLSLKIILDDGAVTKTLMFDTTTKVWEAHQIVRDKILALDPDKEYGFFLTSADNDESGIWLSNDKKLEYYMLKDGDSVLYLTKIRNLRLRMLDGHVKVLQVDESNNIENLMVFICQKIGVANHEEYGLCRVDADTVEDTKPNMGTLTLRKNTKVKEKDVQLEQLRKKFKTDDNVEWLDQMKTLRECRVNPNETLLFKRRLFYSDRNVDSRDPVQLNLLYVQTRDAILDGRQVVTVDKAAEFAGIQCQIQYGDFLEEKHKPGFIENLKEFLPELYASSWGIEKKINSFHRKHQGLSQIEAKHVYTKTARELPTYGVTFFLVKEKHKGKKKLIPRLLGINSESILRLDEETKEILQVWPLTQIKSYKAGSESFTLNFGDYSEKEYAVKTNDAMRIRDILQGYIDIIRKRLAAPYNVNYTEGEAICEEMVEGSRGTLTQNVVASKVIEHSLVGPSQIIAVEQGQQSQQGTRIMTVHDIITTTRTDRSQQPMRGELRNSLKYDFRKKLNHLNSEAVKTVMLLSDPTNENIQEVRRMVAGFEDALPSIMKGVNETAANLSEEESKKLLGELDELCAYIITLASSTKRSDLHDADNLRTAQDAATKIAELSTQMCFSLDPKTRKRSKYLTRSRQSFIMDEKTEASLRRASFITAADGAFQAVQQAQDELDQEYHFPCLTDMDIKDLEKKTVARMGKLNAAIALLLNAHADSKNIDYEMAINSMQTINKIIPELIKDARLLTRVGDEDTKRKLRGQVMQLLDGTRAMCQLTGTDDVSKMQDKANDYADVSKKLIFTFSRPDFASSNGYELHDKENEIMELAKDVGQKISSLLMVANDLTNYDPHDPNATDLDIAGAKCADATQGLLSCAKLTAPSIQEPHCQSALTAAAENLSSAVQNMTLASKPLIEKPGLHGFANQLAERTFDFAKALDRLKYAYSNLNDNNIEPTDESESEIQGRERLKFIMSTTRTKGPLNDADKKLQALNQLPVMMDTGDTKSQNRAAKRLLSQRLGQLNGAIASFLQSTSDPENTDYETAGAAVKTICKLTPYIIDETEALHGSVDENTWNDIMENLKSMLEATQEVCANAENGDIKEVTDAASKLASSSGKLIFIFNPRSKAKKKNQVLDLSKQAIEETSQLLSKVEQLSQRVDNEQSKSLDKSGAIVKGAANNFLRTAEITTPTIEQARCKAALLHATNHLSNRAHSLQASWKPVTQTADYHHTGEMLDENLNRVQNALDKVRDAVQNDNGNTLTINEEDRRKFAATLLSAKNAMDNANKELSKANEMPLTVNNNDIQPTKNLLSQKMSHLNAAIANLLQATSDNERPDYEAAAVAINAISNLTPDIIKDAKTLQGTMDDKSWNDVMENLKSMVDTTTDICTNVDDPQELNDLATNLADSAKQLTYVFHPNRNINKENKILDLSKAAVKDMSVLLSNVYDLADDVGGAEEENLDIIGIRTVNSTQALLKTAEITAPNIESSICQKSLLFAIDSLSKNVLDLQNCWEPLVKLPIDKQTPEQLDSNLKQVLSSLDKLKRECQGIDVSKEDKTGKLTEEQEKQRLQFAKTLSVARESMATAHKELKDANNLLSNKLSKSEDNANAPMQKMLLSQKLAKLNAAIAGLYQATSDRENPNYKEAMGSINFISNITPNIIIDVKSLRGSVDDKSWKDIMEHLKSIVDATSDIYAKAEDPEKLHESASELANSAGRLRFIFVPPKNAKKGNQILDLSKSLVEEASVLLSHVYQLTESVDGKEGEKLDTAGVKVVDAAQILLKTAEFTAPTMEDPHCQETMLHAIDRFSGRSIDLQNTWKPLAKTPKHHQTTQELDQELKQVHSTMGKLKEACRNIGENETVIETPEQQKQRIQFIETLSRSQNAMAKADKELKDANNMPNNVTTKTVDKSIAPATKKLLSQKLAHLNAAIASLLQATSNHENPDYKTAAAAINAISNLTPDIIKDTKTLHGTVDDKSWASIMESLKSIVDSTSDLCANTENPQELKDSASKFANSAGRLTYVFNPRKNIKKENQILDLSKTAVEETSVLLSNVYQLEVGVGGEKGEKLDSVGVQVVESAQILLKTAEITAPTIEDLRCQESLLSAVDHLSGHAQDLQDTWKPLTKNPEYRQTAQQLDQNLNQLNSTLDKLKEACRDVGGNEEEIEAQEQEKQRQHFVATLSSAKNAMMEANTELKEANSIPFKRMSKSVDKSNAPEMKKLLSQKLARLNAAIADLLQATSNIEKPDYKAAAEAMNNISQLTRDVVKDTKTLHGTVDDKSWDNIIESLKSMVDTTNAMCVNNENPQELKDSASKFANSVGRLTYVFNPRRNIKKENQILDLSKTAVEETSVLLSNVYQLEVGVGGEKGEKLDSVGVQVVESAQILLKTAEITAPTIEDLRCQESLLSAVDHLSGHAQDLQDTWKPLTKNPEYRQTAQQLDQNLNQLNSTLDKLKEACRDVGGNEEEIEAQEQEKQRQHFVATLSSAKNAMMEANTELKEANSIPFKRMSKSVDKSNAPETKKLLSQKLARLNAAIADLLQATSNIEKPDYKAAAEAMNNISQLTRDVVKDTKTLHGTVDDKSWDNIIESLKSMVDTTNAMCVNNENPQELKDSASKFANSVGRLTYVFNPRKNIKKEKQILDLSRSAVEETSVLLSNVYQLTERVGGEEGEKLDTAGVKVVDSAQMLLNTAEITSSSIQDAHCQKTLFTAIDHLSDRAQDLQNSWKPIVYTPEYSQSEKELENNLDRVKSTLAKLKQACLESNVDQEEEKQHLQFVDMLSTAKNSIKDASNELKDIDRIPIDKRASKTFDKKNASATKKLLSAKLAELNAAIASLLQATSDHERPDYDAATKAVNTISNLTPEIIKDTKTLHGVVDDKLWKTMVENLKTMVATTNDICNNTENPQELKEIASKFANSAGRLTYVFNPHNNAKKENQIRDLSRCAVEQTSLLLSNVYQLTEKVGGEEGEKLDVAGVKVVESANMLLKTTEITSPNISDVHCQAALLSSVDKMYNNTEDLKNIWQPLVVIPQYQSTGDQLEQNVKIVYATLEKLRKACHDTDDSKECKPDQLLKNISEAQSKIKEVEKLFSEDKIAERALEAGVQGEKTSEKPILARRTQLSNKLAQLNDSIALLIQAMLDRENPDYKKAEQSISVISKLTPEIIQETMALQRNLDDNSRTIVFDEAKAVCEASQEICTSVENNSLEDLNNAATKYAQSSGKLRYVISPQSYPNKEKKILDASRSACERTSLMLSRVSRLAGSDSSNEGERMSLAGAKVADAAHSLFTNAQIISPSIEDRNCQSTLSESADRLMKVAQNLEKLWKPIVLKPQHHQIGEQLSRDISLLNSELDRLKEICHDHSDLIEPVKIQQQPTSDKPKPPPNPKPNMDDLDNILQNIQKNVTGDAKKPKVEERILIEDTPLRRLALKIMESAKVKAAEASSPKDREKYSQFANELSAATHKLDIANAKCRDAPLNSKDKSEKAFQLENAVLNLQLLCIQSRQSDGQQSNIVDLTDFVKDVTFAVDDLNKIAKGIKQEHGREALADIKDKCQKIQHDADELMKPQEEQNENMFEYMLKTGQFAKDCDVHVKEITAAIRNIENEASKKILSSKLRALTDRCDLLSFAAQSSISNGESATLEGSLQNLGEVEKRIEVILKPNEGFNIMKDNKENTHVIQAAQSALTAVVASGNESKLPAGLTRYAVNIRGLNTTERNSKLKDHLQRLMDILKMQIGDKNRRILTWQEVTEGEETKITEKILEELQSFAHDMQMTEMPGVKTTAPIKQVQLIKDVDVKRLLAPSGSHEVGDEKELTAKLNQQLQKLNSMANMIPLSLHKPESLSRSLHSTSETAIQLASIARGLKHHDPVQNKRIEEAAQEMSVATYNLLKTAESVGRSSNQPESRRRLLDAYKALNDTLNNLAKTTLTKNPMQRDCNEMARTIQLQQSFLSSDYPSCALNYVDCVNALQNQQEVIHKLQSEQLMSRTECSTELRYVTSAICNSMEYASQTAYLVSLSNEDQNIVTVGMADVPRIKKLTDSINETCLEIICNDGGKEATEQANLLDSQAHQLEEVIDDAGTKIKEDEKNKLLRNKYKLLEALKGLNTMLRSRNYEEEQIMPTTMKVIDTLNDINTTIDRIHQPKIDKDPKKIQMSKEVIESTKSLMTSTSTMLKKASSTEVEKITWGMIGSIDVIKSFEALLICIREKGVQAGYVKPLVTTPPKSFVQTQVDLACHWLKKPASKESDKTAGIGAVEKLVEMAEEMSNDLQGGEKEELKHVVHETKQLLKDCTVKYNSDKASVLMDRLRELRKMLERGVVTRVVEDFLEEEPLANLEALHKENDEKKRKFLLEKKIAELLAQLGRVTKTARFVADTAVVPRPDLLKTSGQVELLAPSLVKAAEERIRRPDDKATIEHYQKLLAEYAESLSKVRDLCDRAVDPIDFTQAASETMQRIKEESLSDPHKSVHNSQKIMKLCNRVIEVSMDSDYVQKDPDIKKTLVDIKRAVEDKYDKHADWKDITAEFMRRTGEVESVLGGENIFLRQPEPNQPIYAAALDLHAAVRDWSARDNEIVAVAKRMAVQMARLSDYMNTGKTRELIISSNTIISLSKEVTALAKKLALECSDIRIRTNLQQVCDRIPTISGQLKMLTTVKGSSLGHQDTAEDKEAMTMLVGNAQNLMKSIQEVVKAAASASVKIMSQKGYRMKWKRRNYY